MLPSSDCVQPLLLLLLLLSPLTLLINIQWFRSNSDSSCDRLLSSSCLGLMVRQKMQFSHMNQSILEITDRSVSLLSLSAAVEMISASMLRWRAPTCERLDAGAFEEAGRAVLVVPFFVPAVVDRVVAAVLLLQLHVVELGRHRRHHDHSPLTHASMSAGTRPHRQLQAEPCGSTETGSTRINTQTDQQHQTTTTLMIDKSAVFKC